MKLSFCTDSLGHLPFEPMLDRLLELGVRGVEMTTGGWSPAPVKARDTVHLETPAFSATSLAVALWCFVMVASIPASVKSHYTLLAQIP